MNYNRDTTLLLVMLKYTTRILRLKKSVNTYEKMLEDTDYQDLFSFWILQIGENAKNISDDFRKQHTTILWKEIAGMRDIAAHGYESFDLPTLWNVVDKEILPLHEFLLQQTNE